MIQAAQQAMYAAAPRAQFLPDPGTPGAKGLGNLATLRGHKSVSNDGEMRKEIRPTELV